jgi:hypothetical protein
MVMTLRDTCASRISHELQASSTALEQPFTRFNVSTQTFSKDARQHILGAIQVAQSVTTSTAHPLSENLLNERIIAFLARLIPPSLSLALFEDTPDGPRGDLQLGHAAVLGKLNSISVEGGVEWADSDVVRSTYWWSVMGRRLIDQGVCCKVCGGPSRLCSF